MGPFDTMFGGASDPDRLGIGLKSRAKRERMSADPREGFGRHVGPLGDPQWAGFFQALQEAGVDRVADNSVGEARGMFPQSAPYEHTFDPMQGQTSAVLASGPSNQIGGQNPALDAIFRIMGEEKMAPRVSATKRPQGPVRTTGQSKLRVERQRGGSKV